MNAVFASCLACFSAVRGRWSAKIRMMPSPEETTWANNNHHHTKNRITMKTMMMTMTKKYLLLQYLQAQNLCRMTTNITADSPESSSPTTLLAKFINIDNMGNDLCGHFPHIFPTTIPDHVNAALDDSTLVNFYVPFTIAVPTLEFPTASPDETMLCQQHMTSRLDTL